MTKRVLDVGNCGPDHAAIRNYLTRNFDVDIVQVDDADGATAQLHAGNFDLVLVNRKLDIDYSDGMEVIRVLKANSKSADVPVMLITNYPDQQEAAMEIGAVRGFGKLEFGKTETRERLAAILE